VTSASPPAPAAVLDTNVVLDWLVFRDPALPPLATAIETGVLRWLATARMRAEFAEVLARPHLDRWGPDRELALATFDRVATMQDEPPPSRLICSDPDDQVYIDLAVAARCAWLVTHDRALLELAGRARALGVQVLPPARWPAA
jgi:predicted nucleic acid-binding protein